MTRIMTPEQRAKAAASRAYNAKPTTRPGSESTTLGVGDPVMVRLGASRGYSGRKGWVASLNPQTFPSGVAYVEIGVTWRPHSNWEKAAAETWFRDDELSAR